MKTCSYKTCLSKYYFNFPPSSKPIFTVKLTLQLVYLLLFPIFYNSSHIYFKFHIWLFTATFLSIKSESNWNIHYPINGLISIKFGNKSNEILIITTAWINPERVCWVKEEKTHIVWFHLHDISRNADRQEWLLGN